MARGFNKVVLMGNLARDPEVRHTVDKRAWARFTVAVNYSWKNKAGEYQESADFIPVVAWGPLAERCGRYLKKGSAVLIEGKISVRDYEAKDGTGKRYITEVVASEVMFVGPKRTSESGPFDGSPVSSSRSFDSDIDFGKSIQEKGFGDAEDDFSMDFLDLDKGDKDAEIPF